MLYCSSSYLAWLPTLTFFLTSSYPYLHLCPLCVSSDLSCLSHLPFPPCPHPKSPSPMQTFACVCHFLFENTSKHLLFFADHVSPRQKFYNKTPSDRVRRQQHSFFLFQLLPALQSELTLTGCRSDLVATACSPKLPSGCEIWQARQPFSYSAYTCTMQFFWSMSIRFYLYLCAELNSSLDAAGNGAVFRCSVDAVNRSNCCLIPLCGKCKSSRKPPRDDGAVMVTDGKDDV